MANVFSDFVDKHDITLYRLDRLLGVGSGVTSKWVKGSAHPSKAIYRHLEHLDYCLEHDKKRFIARSKEKELSRYRRRPNEDNGGHDGKENEKGT